jgi:hypothetical protein
MLPLGLLLIAHDVAFLRQPVGLSTLWDQEMEVLSAAAFSEAVGGLGVDKEVGLCSAQVSHILREHKDLWGSQ